MRTPRLISIVLSWMCMIAVVYLGYAMELPRGVLPLMFFGAFVPYLLWLRLEPYFE